MRAQDWPERLAAYVESRRTVPFEYGSHDCCHFAGGAVDAITGRNPMAAFHYRNQIGAERAIRKAGSLDALVEQTLGKPMAVALARRGDVVIADLERGATVGICTGAEAVFASEIGVTFRPMSSVRKAWRIE